MQPETQRCEEEAFHEVRSTLAFIILNSPSARGGAKPMAALFDGIETPPAILSEETTKTGLEDENPF
jgi:hypothetical protein